MKPIVMRASLSLAAAFGGLAVALGAASGTAVAEPVDTDGSAQSVINQLQDQGYNVVINWVNGYDTKSLSICTVDQVNDPSSDPPTHGEFVTVYVDVRCPNHDYD